MIEPHEMRVPPEQRTAAVSKPKPVEQAERETRARGDSDSNNTTQNTTTNIFGRNDVVVAVAFIAVVVALFAFYIAEENRTAIQTVRADYERELADARAQLQGEVAQARTDAAVAVGKAEGGAAAAAIAERNSKLAQYQLEESAKQLGIKLPREKP